MSRNKYFAKRSKTFTMARDHQYSYPFKYREYKALKIASKK